jgi:heme exporter protein D
MDEKTIYWAAVTMSALALLLLVINMSMFNSNKQLQEEVTQRQAVINDSIPRSQINKGLVQALAGIAVKGDTDARSLLAEQGITLNTPAPAAKEDDKEAPAVAAKPAPKAKKKPSSSDDD